LFRFLWVSPFVKVPASGLFINIMMHIAILASGGGTNAENLIRYFNGVNENGAPDSPSNAALHAPAGLARVDLVISNNPAAPVLLRASRLKVKYLMLDKEQLCSEENPDVIKYLKHNGINFIILAGYLLQVPKALIYLYPERIVNIHPALLPKFGGKGMYGAHVHKAVIESHEKESGITVHLVDEQMDHGKILFQAKCQVTPEDTPETLAAKIHILEQANFPKAVEHYIKERFPED
jgi:phosphoribosylglycinamide formyltransferase-1